MSGQYFIFPFYHTVSDDPRACVRHLYPVPSVAQFRSDLDFLLSEYQPATVTEVMDYINSGKKPDKPRFFLSFDDGFSECSEVIAPILREKGLQAAFFITVACVGNRFLAHRQKVSLVLDAVLSHPIRELPSELYQLAGLKSGDLSRLLSWLRGLDYFEKHTLETIADILDLRFSDALDGKPYMDLREIKELKANGHLIGSHSMDHPEFYRIPDETMSRQIDDSFKFLRDEVGEDRRFFAFPFTDHGVPGSFFSYLRRQPGVISFGTAGLKNDPEPGHIQRIPMEVEGMKGAEQVLRSEYSYYLAKALLRKNSILRK
jgi:peptidoglycan/xylan/chitin deacetylase (PgdA/CDA1 family)